MSASGAPRLCLESELALRLCRVVDTPTSLAVFLLIQNQEWQQLVEKKIDPKNYLDSDVRRFKDDYLVTSILRKSPNIPLGIDRMGVALSSFLDAEGSNTQTNARLYGAKHPAWFYDVQQRARLILGPLTPSALNRIWSLTRFGPGATTGVPGERSVASQKFDATMHLTHGLMPFARSLMGDLWANLQKVKLIVKGSGFFTVPKNALTDRGCAKEPTLNSFLQLGIGSYVKTRLLRFGTDLRDQTWNQTLALHAQDWRLATLDLSKASDTMSRALVDELLTSEWASLLSLARSPFMKLPGDAGWRELAMHSSMGNGYTFDLETVIFKSVVESIVPPDLWCFTGVYGDDIICPRQYAKQVVSALEYLGFSVNGAKTHLAGVFFESCGMDVFNGVPVRPFYCSREEDSPIPYQLQLANALRLWAEMPSGECDVRFREIWTWLSKKVPKLWRHPVPKELGDTGLLVSIEEARPMPATYLSEYYGWEGYVAKHVILKSRLKKRPTWGHLLMQLARAGSYHGWWSDPPARTYGSEPIRGLYGRPRTGVAVVLWQPGLCWTNPA